MHSSAEQDTHPQDSVERFHSVLLESIRARMPSYLRDPFTVAEIYQSLVPYRSHRDRLGLAMTGDYEDTLLRLLAGEGEFLTLESEPARKRIRKELESNNPNTGIYREFAAAEVYLNRSRSEGGSVLVDVPDESPRKGSREVPPPSDTPGPTRKKSKTSPSDPARGWKAQAGSTPCPDCGGVLPKRESLRFCPYCGTDTLEVPCGSCGEILDREWRFCVACGVPTRG